MIPIILAIHYPTPSMIGVKYPRRKSLNLIMNVQGFPLHCLQCSTDITVETLLGHIRSHAPSKKPRPVVTPDGREIMSVSAIPEEEA